MRPGGEAVMWVLKLLIGGIVGLVVLLIGIAAVSAFWPLFFVVVPIWCWMMHTGVSNG
jgi:hypothetical protein